MANFPCIEELAIAANSTMLFNGMMLYFEKENANDLAFATTLHNLWVKLLNGTNEKRLFINELERLLPSVMPYKVLEFLHKVQNHDVIKLLELRKMVVETYRQVSKNINLIEAIRTM
ncbi:hypothetical protein Tco_1110663 [Tanacetum coccineum]|uniref:Uncharacterized protein n=1 Tax=Tanacetum coccineum TaxID=301880 RepID=A0ABQ5IKY5_9ASTR